MRGFSAREMLSQLPLRMAHGGDISSSLLRMAHGGDVGNYLSLPAEHSDAYRRAEKNPNYSSSADAIQAYYQSLREVAQTYLADTDAPTGAEAYNVMLEAGISTTDLINAGVGEDVLSKIFTLTEDPSFFTLPPTDLESAYLGDPVLMAEAARISAEGGDGVASLQQQARDYVAHVKEDGITDAEREEMRHYATTRGYTIQDFLDAGIDPSILYKTPTAPDDVCPPGSKLAGQPIPADLNCNPDVTPTVCPPGSKLAGEPIPADLNCNPDVTPTVCPPGTVLAGQPIPADLNCNPDVTPTVCPPGTVLAGQPIPADGNCDPTTKTCPVGTRLSGHIIPIADECDPTTKLCPTGTVLAGQTIPYEDDCDPATKVCPSGTKLANQTVAYGADCDPTTKVCPAGTKKHGETIPFEDDCNAVDIIYCPPETRLGGQPVPPDGDCNPPLRCPEGSELAGLPIPTDGECNPTSVPVYCDVGTELEGQLMPANGDCNPTKFPTTKVCPAGSELENQTIAIEDSCDPTTVTKPPTVYGTTKVCPAGTARAGATIPIDDDCDASLPTTKVCPPGTKLANQTIGIADDCEGPGIYPAGEPALDTTFRESAPRTQATYTETQADGTEVTKDLPGQYTYTPAAKLLPATGSGLSWTPPSVTSRPRSLLSPGAIQEYGGMTSASQRFAQNRRTMDRTILQAFQTADVYDPSAIRDFRQQARAGLFSNDLGAFDLDQFQSAFDIYLSLRPTADTTGGTTTGGTTTGGTTTGTGGTGGQRADSYWGRFPRYGPLTDEDRSGATAGVEGDEDMMTGADMGYFGPITPVDLRYGVPGQFFAKGGPVGLSARNMLAQYANGGSVSAGRNLESEGWTKTGVADPLYIHEDPPFVDKEVTPLADPQPAQTESASMLRNLDTSAMEQIQRSGPPPAGRGTDQTESASMLESIGKGASMIPETVANYFIRPGDKGPASFSMVSPSELGSDIKFLGGAMWEAAKAEPFRFAMDILPVIGELVSAHDVGKFTDMANKAEAEGKPALADMFRQIVTLSAAGTVPLAGMGARVTKRSVISAAKKAAEEATTTSARMLDDVVVAGSTSPIRMLDEVAEAGARRATETDIPYIKFSDDFAEKIRARTQEPTNNNGYMGAQVAADSRVVGDSVAETFNRQIADDPMGMIELYKKLKDAEGGKVHDTDAFRELSSNYLADRSLSPSVHEPASALNKMYYAMRLAETQGQEGRWLFTGGGPGSGKSSGPAGPMRDSADLVFDGTLAKFDTNVLRIDDALKSGKDVDIVFVDRAPEKAIRQAVGRAMRQVKKEGSGRTIPIDHFAQMHVDSRKTIKQLVERYKGNPDVRIKLINNNGGPNDAARLSEGFTIDQIADLDYNQTVRRVTAVLEEMKREGKGVISDDIYRGFIKNTRLDDISPTTTPTLDTRRASSQGGTQRGNGQSVQRNAGQLGRERRQVQASTVGPTPVETTTAASTSARGAL